MLIKIISCVNLGSWIVLKALREDYFIDWYSVFFVGRSGTCRRRGKRVVWHTLYSVQLPWCQRYVEENASWHKTRWGSCEKRDWPRSPTIAVQRSTFNCCSHLPFGIALPFLDMPPMSWERCSGSTDRLNSCCRIEWISTNICKDALVG
jgi:hypothetical protein